MKNLASLLYLFSTYFAGILVICRCMNAFNRWGQNMPEIDNIDFHH